MYVRRVFVRFCASCIWARVCVLCLGARVRPVFGRRCAFCVWARVCVRLRMFLHVHYCVCVRACVFLCGCVCGCGSVRVLVRACIYA